MTHVVRLITETVSLPQLLLWPEALRANSRLDSTPPLGPAWFLPSTLACRVGRSTSPNDAPAERHGPRGGESSTRQLIRTPGRSPTPSWLTTDQQKSVQESVTSHVCVPPTVL